MRALLFLLLASVALHAQSVSILNAAPNNGGYVTLVYLQDKAGDTLCFAEAPNPTTHVTSHPWLYVGHTPYQASLRLKGSTTPTLYTSFSTGLAAFKKLSP